jgi:hypothetical protein
LALKTINNPTRYLILNQQTFKGILELQIIPTNNTLQFYFAVHQFQKTSSPNYQIPPTIIESFNANNSNKELFETLPIERRFANSLSYTESEIFLLNLEKTLASNDSNSNSLIPISFNGKLKIYLNYLQIFGLRNFVSQFINNYELLKLQLEVLSKESPDSSIESPSINKDSKPFKTHPSIIVSSTTDDDSTPEYDSSDSIVEDVEVTNEFNTLNLINDILKLSPNNYTTYFISKYIQSLIENGIQKECPFTFKDEFSININIDPLLNIRLFSYSQNHYNTLINTLSSFEFTQDEYYSKLRLLIQELNYILKLYNDTKNYNNLIIPIQLTEFLIFIYADKLASVKFQNKFKSNLSYYKVNNHILSLVNYAIEKITKMYFETNTKITFTHMLTSDIERVTSNNEELDLIATKERHLLTIDKDAFINEVLRQKKNKDESKTINKNSNKTNLILSYPKLVNIENILTQSNSDDTLFPRSNNLTFALTKPNLKQLEKHKIITNEYHQILELSVTPDISKSILSSKLHPILTKYSSVVLDIIFPELSNNLDSSSSLSTLYLLTNYIRPFLNEESSIEIEFFILYRLVIPFLYDMYNVTQFIDFFH